MPWTKLSYDEALEIYKEIACEIYQQRDTDSIVNELIVRGEILKFDFTKRQRIIINFIITFSYNFGKDWAYIPKLIDFELAGISKTKIKSELKNLVNMNVIEWQQEENLFKIKSNNYWKVPYNAGYNDKRTIDLLFINMQHAGIEISELMKKLKTEI